MKLTFEQFYSDLWKEDWPELLLGLQGPDAKVDRENRFREKGLAQTYTMDPASILVAHALQVEPHHQVLDLCAAPGGKSLILAEALWAEGDSPGTLILNERSSERRARLKRVLEEYVPEQIRERIQVSSHDATRWSQFENSRYDRILLDAPCSSERHVLKSPKHLKEWTPARTRLLAKKQFSMLASALELLKPGGQLIYSTCSISHLENDGVLENILDRVKDRLKKGKPVAEIEIAQEVGSNPFGIPIIPTRFGWQVLPKRDQSAGPMYWAKLKRSEG